MDGDGILVVMCDDEEDFRAPVRRYLERRGMRVLGAGSVAELERLLTEVEPQVILLDVGLPGEDGLSAVARLRDRVKAGLVMLTARGDTDSRVRGRMDGADNYLSKPVDLRELEAVIRALARRLGDQAPRGAAEIPWEVDPVGWSLIAPGGRAVSLSAAQWAVVDLLTLRPGQPVSRQELEAAAGLTPRATEDRRLDVLMSRLRRRLADGLEGGAPPVMAARNQGYVFTAPVRRAERDRSGADRR